MNLWNVGFCLGCSHLSMALPSCLIAVPPAELSELELVRTCSLMLQILLLLEPVSTFLTWLWQSLYCLYCSSWLSFSYLLVILLPLLSLNLQWKTHLCCQNSKPGNYHNKRPFVNQLDSVVYRKCLNVEQRPVEFFYYRNSVEFLMFVMVPETGIISIIYVGKPCFYSKQIQPVIRKFLQF